MPTKIDQAFLEKVAKIHNTDYPKEYWDNGGHMTTEKQETMIRQEFRDCIKGGYTLGIIEDFIVSEIKAAVQKAHIETVHKEEKGLNDLEFIRITLSASDNKHTDKWIKRALKFIDTKLASPTTKKDYGCDMHDRSIHGDIPDDAYCNHCIRQQSKEPK